jgi:hypothetical protein
MTVDRRGRGRAEAMLAGDNNVADVTAEELEPSGTPDSAHEVSMSLGCDSEKSAPTARP